MKNIQTLLSWFTRNWEEIKDSHSWYNTKRILTLVEIEKIKNNLLKRKETKLVIIINGTKWLRPQRTWGDLPEYLRSADADHTLFHDNNAFVFVNCYCSEVDKSYADEKRKLLQSAKEIAEETQSKLYIFDKENKDE